jgi:hypothetical protein
MTDTVAQADYDDFVSPRDLAISRAKWRADQRDMNQSNGPESQWAAWTVVQAMGLGIRNA